MHYNEEVTFEIVGTFWCPHSDSAPKELRPSRYAPADDGRVAQSSRMLPTLLKPQNFFIASLNRMRIIPRKTWTILETLQRRNSYKDKKIAPNYLCNKSAHQAAKVWVT